MILKFKFKNYKSFKNEVCLDLTAKKITEFSDSNFEIGNTKVLPVASIFGANASGKSNVIDAFRFMRKFVLDSLYEMVPERQGSNGRIRTKAMPFLFDDDMKNNTSKFETQFVLIDDDTEKIYCFGFEVKDFCVKEEWLGCKSKTSREDFKNIYHRKEKKIEWRGIDSKIIQNIEASLKDNVLIMTLGAMLNEQLLKRILDFFRKTNIVNFGDVEEDYYIFLGHGYTRYVLYEKVQKEIAKYLNSFDNSIIDISAEEHMFNMLGRDNEIYVYVHHKKKNSTEVVKLPLGMESAGTQKMFHLYAFLQGSLMEGNALMIDELNSKLHPFLIKSIVAMYLNKSVNKKNAQLIFTSHDIWQLKSGILRRDEIWFTEKDEDSISNLYSLSDFVDKDGEKIRKDEDYLKHYVQRKYGAVPTLKGFDEVFG
ncbi:MAG: AAA family ATPase [Lachnospiraceae bacterium]|nr:AAA family ATPase [Lachnospiraceae bacterium]